MMHTAHGAEKRVHEQRDHRLVRFYKVVPEEWSGNF